MNVLELDGVSKRIGKRLIIDKLSMRVEPGEVYGFLGPNGAGKTTTIRMIVGLARPTEGRIRIMGHDVQTDRRNALAQVGAIVENPEMYSYLTGEQNLLHFARLAGLRNPSSRINEVAELVGLKDRIADKVKRYSLGMRQRLGVAQALLSNPRLLILDEPTNGLDPAGMREFRELMRNLADNGLSVFVSSHLLAELQQMCDRVAIVKSGRIIVEQRLSDLVNQSAREVKLSVGSAELAGQVLTGLNVPHRVTGERTVQVQVAEDGVPSVVRSLVSANIDVFAIEPQGVSLEQAFLELTDEAPEVESRRQNVKGGVVHA